MFKQHIRTFSSLFSVFSAQEGHCGELRTELTEEYGIIQHVVRERIWIAFVNLHEVNKGLAENKTHSHIVLTTYFCQLWGPLTFLVT